jgi:hypothetical protein
MPVFVGDTLGSLTGKQQGGDQTVEGGTIGSNTLFGDAQLAITDMAGGGDDILVGGPRVFGLGLSNNLLFGDSHDLSGRGQGGNDSLTGGDVQGGGGLINTLYGDALNVFGFARGGDDSVTGGNNVNSGGGFLLENNLYGDGDALSGKALGGNDTVTGGNSSGSGSTSSVSNLIVGDANTMSDTAKGGNDVLIAGTGDFTLNPNAVNNTMYGDAVFMSGLAKGGADTFVFHDSGSMTVGTQNFINDFSLSQHDKIEFIGVVGVSGFANLHFDTFTTPGSTIIHAGGDDVTLVGFTGTLTAQDFLFG